MKNNTLLVSSNKYTTPPLALWLDGKDASTMILSGSNVLIWTDKSGNNITTNSVTGNITYDSVTGVTFPTSTQFTVPMQATTGTMIIASNSGVVALRVNIPAGNYIIRPTNVGRSIIGIFIYNGFLNLSDIQTVINNCVANGAGSYASITNFGNFLSSFPSMTGLEMVDLSNAVWISSAFNVNNSNMIYISKNLFDNTNNLVPTSTSTNFINIANTSVYDSIITSFSKNSSIGFAFGGASSSNTISKDIVYALCNKACFPFSLNISISWYKRLNSTGNITWTPTQIDTVSYTNSDMINIIDSEANQPLNISCDGTIEPSIFAITRNNNSVDFNGGLSGNGCVIIFQNTGGSGSTASGFSSSAPIITFNNVNTYSGNTSVCGTLHITNPLAIGSGKLILSSGARVGTLLIYPVFNNTSESIMAINNETIFGYNVILCSIGNDIIFNNTVTIKGTDIGSTNLKGYITIGTGRNVTLNGTINGPFLGKTGGGSLTINGTSNISSELRIYAGTLNIGGPNAIGTGNFILGGSIDNTSGFDLTISTNNTQSWSSFTFIGTNNLNLGNGDVTLAGTATVTILSNTLIVNGNITSSGLQGLIKAGAGTLILNGTNSYSGATNIAAGSLVITKPISGPSKISSATFTNTTLIVNFSSNPTVGETYKLLPASTTQTYASVTLTGAGVSGRTASYNSTTSTLTIS